MKRAMISTFIRKWKRWQSGIFLRILSDFLVCIIPITIRFSSDSGRKGIDILRGNVPVSCASFMNSLLYGTALLERGLDIDRDHCYHESSGWFCKHRTAYDGEYQRGKPLLAAPQPPPEVPETALAA
jgi:hypothetical protein